MKKENKKKEKKTINKKKKQEKRTRKKNEKKSEKQEKKTKKPPNKSAALTVITIWRKRFSYESANVEGRGSRANVSRDQLAVGTFFFSFYSMSMRVLVTVS